MRLAGHENSTALTPVSREPSRVGEEAPRSAKRRVQQGRAELVRHAGCASLTTQRGRRSSGKLLLKRMASPNVWDVKERRGRDG